MSQEPGSLIRWAKTLTDINEHQPQRHHLNAISDPCENYFRPPVEYVKTISIPGSSPVSIMREQRPGCLRLWGRVLGTVEAIGHPIHGSVMREDLLEALWTLLFWYEQRKLNLGSDKAQVVETFSFGLQSVESVFEEFKEFKRWSDPYLILDNCERQGLATAMTTLAARRRLFRTTDGICGWGPTDTQPGDEVITFPGGRLPFVLRRSPENSSYEYGTNDCFRLIGDCFHSLGNSHFWPPKPAQDIEKILCVDGTWLGGPAGTSWPSSPIQNART
ncbi:uncharacterized protein JN550_001163 [Neoarthrinium moseri]|uniref:uncharacterized protein n=1 Tax=Neoarthrinium moseri TaxID=1658444 RepID=UPI001FDD9D8D|nr:uncharacterized protein JN550_001163 [Neoarthrinium moseri]KAI1877091.1 hypothetical protein JN550_001163 [Neoarthrinium moseri]